MNLYTIGINHKTAPIDIRERFYLTATEQDLFLSELKNDPRFIEAFVLSTCNRTEVYSRVLERFNPGESIFSLLTKIKKIQKAKQYCGCFYTYQDDQAVEHLLNVTSGLDSLVIGEREILGQVKDAFERARQHQMMQKHFNLLSQFVIRTGKKAHSETQIGFGGSSVSWAAVAKAEEILGSLQDKSILLIGAGQMSELAVGHIQNKKFKKLYVMNRTGTNAQELVQKYGGEAVGFMDMKEILSEVDFCICSASAPHYILEKGMLEKILPLRRGRPLLLIDISMPRNIDPAVKDLDSVTLYEIDDLNEVVETTMQIRQKAISQVQDIIQRKLSEFRQRLQNDELVSPTSLLDAEPRLTAQ